MGRSEGQLAQHLGVGSVVYIFVLALFLWLLLWPLTPPYWSFLNILTFVSLTSPPAILYALPVRHGLELHTAQTVRLWLLAIVAGWRVALLIFYLRRSAGFEGGRLALASFFPLLLIIFILTTLNLERVVFSFMGGLRPEDHSVNDGAYSVLFLLSLISMLMFLPLLVAYLFTSVNSVIATYGKCWAKIFYGLSAIFAAAGAVILTVNDKASFGMFFVSMGLVIASSTLIKMQELKSGE